jgi:hypothetical protein
LALAAAVASHAHAAVPEGSLGRAPARLGPMSGDAEAEGRLRGRAKGFLEIKDRAV